ncbi:DUF1993 family protein [soil metagenome]
MALTMYQALVPPAARMLHNLAVVLEKAEAHADAQGIEASVLIEARLYPDMLPLSRQVQIATDIASRGAARLADKEPASVPDTERSFDELDQRIRHAIEYLESFPREQIDGSEERSIRFKAGGEDVTLNGRDYLLHFVWPNVYFHITTAYAILRHNGVPLGKRDYLGGR